MKKRSLLVLAVMAFLGVQPLFAVKCLVRLDNLSHGQILEMAGRGDDITRCGKNFAEVVVDESQVKLLEKTGQKPTVLIPDLNAYVKQVLAAQTRADKYYTYDTMTVALKDYATKYPSICHLESIGKSCENRDIWALKISDNPEKNEKEPAVLIMGAHHSREWISFEVPMAAIKVLLEGYGKDEKITGLVNGREIWIVPMVNPDGVTYSQKQSQYWRKNRRKNSDGTYGVDVNRNYGYQWGNVGASSNTNSDTYHGTAAFSEPESKAIRDLAKREKFSASISFHSYSELVLFPFGYANNVPCPDHEVLAKFAGEMAQFNQYTPENSAELYPAMGDSDDWLYGDQKDLAFTIELAQTFIPAPSDIDNINALNVPAVLHLIDKAGTYGLVTPTGEELVKNLSPKEAIRAVVDLLPFALQPVVGLRLEALQHRLAKAIVQERTQGETLTRDQLVPEVKTNPVAAAILKEADLKQSFESLHQNATNGN